MAKNNYGMQKPVQNNLQQCINSYERTKNGGIGIADELVYDTCKRALKYIDELEAKLSDAVPIVRCKDCKNYEYTLCGWCKELERPITLDDYCSYGEKRN